MRRILLLSLGSFFVLLASFHSWAEVPEKLCEVNLKSGDNLRPIFESWKEIVGARLSELMTGKRGPLVKRITQEEMAEALGVSQSNVNQMISGVALLTKDQGDILASLLQSDFNHLFTLAKFAENTFRWNVKDKRALEQYLKWASETPGRSQYVLSLDVDVAQSKISKFLNNINSLNRKEALLLAKALSLDPYEFFEEQRLYRIRLDNFNEALLNPALGRFRVYSQADINSISGIPQASVSRILTGERVLKLEEARKIAEHFSVPLKWVLAAEFLEYERDRHALDVLLLVQNPDQKVYGAFTQVFLGLGLSENLTLSVPTAKIR